MSENLDLVRSIYAAWARGDYYSSVEWAHPEIEFVVMDGPSPGGLTGVAAVEDNWREFQRAWEDYRIPADEYRQLDGDRVLALVRLSGQGKTSGLEMGQKAANLFTLRSGKVTRLVVYWDRDRALTDLGLKE
jgi:ketosteroid isomerase-like protein